MKVHGKIWKIPPSDVANLSWYPELGSARSSLTDSGEDRPDTEPNTDREKPPYMLALLAA